MIIGGKRKGLIVSSTDSGFQYLKDNLTARYDLDLVKNGAEARRALTEKDYGAVFINTPLKDEFGTELAETAVTVTAAAVMLIVRQDVFDGVEASMERLGVFLVSKPIVKQTLYQAVSLMISTETRLNAYRLKAENLNKKMEEIKLVGRAKLLLISKLAFTEQEAHKYIEKQAMDRCVKRAEVAADIIKTYDN